MAISSVSGSGSAVRPSDTGVTDDQQTTTDSTSATGSATSATGSSTSATSTFAAAGPSGVVKQGDAEYRVADGRVSLNGKEIGTVDDAGNYSVTIDGQRATGNVAQLVGATYSGTLSDGQKVDNRPTGSVQVGLDEYEVFRGDVYSQGQHIGTVNSRGDYDVTIGGVRQQNNLGKVSGAIYQALTPESRTTQTNMVSGTVTVGADRFEVEQGRVFHQGKPIGTITDHGSFDVEVDGRRVTGALADLKDVQVTINGAGYVAAPPDVLVGTEPWPEWLDRDGPTPRPVFGDWRRGGRLLP